jgi:hypothetical protein
MSDQRLAVHAVYTGGINNTYNLIGKSRGKRSSRTYRLRWEVNTETELMYGGGGCRPGLSGSALRSEGSYEHSTKTQNDYVFGLFPSSGIIETRKHDVSETGSVSALRCGGRHLLRWVP